MHTQFQQGRAARLAGRPLSANPHQPHDQAHNDWHDGWTSQPRPCYLVRDNLKNREFGDLTYDEASKMATDMTRDANPDRLPSDLDRFTIHRDYD